MDGTGAAETQRARSFCLRALARALASVIAAAGKEVADTSGNRLPALSNSSWYRVSRLRFIFLTGLLLHRSLFLSCVS